MVRRSGSGPLKYPAAGFCLFERRSLVGRDVHHHSGQVGHAADVGARPGHAHFHQLRLGLAADACFPRGGCRGRLFFFCLCHVVAMGSGFL